MSAAPKSPQENAESTIGTILAAAREQKGLPLEKAAHDTRIRTSRLREIEADDFSQFSHPNYARMFLLDYAKYLDVPSPSIKRLLPERGECGAEGYQYLQENPSEAVLQPQRLARRRRRFLPVLATVAGLVILGFLGLQVVIFKSKFDRVNTAPHPARESLIQEDKALLESENGGAAPTSASTAALEPALPPSDAGQPPLYVGSAPEHPNDSFR